MEYFRLILLHTDICAYISNSCWFCVFARYLNVYIYAFTNLVCLKYIKISYLVSLKIRLKAKCYNRIIMIAI